MSLYKSAFTVGGFTLLSRIMGYARDILIASMLGASFIADAFLVAFRLPNFFRTLSAEGAFNAAFVPLFAGKLSEQGQEEAVTFASHVLSFMFVTLLALTILMQIFMPLVMHVLAPGFTDDPAKFEMTVHLGRVVFPYLLCISIVSLFSGILNSIGKFAAAAATPIWLNLCNVVAMLALSHYYQTPAHALAWSSMFAGLVQLVWVIAAARRNGIVVRLSMPKLGRDVKTLLRRMVPGIIGGGVMQINVWVNTVIATTLSGAVSYLYYADRLVQFPLGIIGTAMGTVLLPTLSRQIKEQKHEEAIATQNKALEIVLFLTIPAAVALMVIAHPLISIMFERGKFGPVETSATASAVIAYAFGLPAFVLVKIFAPNFFANGNTKTPVKIGLICLAVNVVMNLCMIRYLGHVGLAIGTTVSSWLNTSLLCGILIKKGLYHSDPAVNSRLLRYVASALLMGLVLWFLPHQFPTLLQGGFASRLLAMCALMGTGAATYFAAAHVSGAARLSDLKSMMRK